MYGVVGAGSAAYIKREKLLGSTEQARALLFATKDTGMQRGLQWPAEMVGRRRRGGWCVMQVNNGYCEEPNASWQLQMRARDGLAHWANNYKSEWLQE